VFFLRHSVVVLSVDIGALCCIDQKLEELLQDENQQIHDVLPTSQLESKVSCRMATEL